MLQTLSSKGFDCHHVREGKECQLKVYQQKYSAVLLDPDLQNHSGIEVLKFLKLKHPAVQVIMVFPDQKRSDDYKELCSNSLRAGISKTFVRPLSVNNIVDYLNDLTPSESWKKSSQDPSLPVIPDSEVSDKDCTRVDIAQFFSETPVIFDHYLRISPDHFVKVIGRGESLTSTQVKKYANDGVKYFYFLTRERRNYINFLNEVLKTSMTKSTVAKSQVLSQMVEVSEKFIEEFNVRGLRPDLVIECKNMSRNSFKFIQESQSLRKIMTDFSQLSPELYNKAFLVSFLAGIISRNIQWIGPSTLEAITLAAYLQDIGFVNLPPHVIELQPHEMNAADLALYKDHPRTGADMLSLVPEVSAQVIQIVHQHHELSSGEGFPHGLKGNRVYPMARIISLANALAGLMIRKKLCPLLAMKEFLNEKSQLRHYDPMTIHALLKAFKESGSDT